MKITQKNNTCFNFRAGFNQIIKAEEKFTNSTNVEQIFADTFGIEASFLNNKSGACANKISLGLFNTIRQKLNFNFSMPPSLNIYEKNNLINSKNPNNFCIPDTMEVIKNDYPFPGRSIFFRDFKNLEEINENTEIMYNNKQISSNHFLAPFVHEWLHSIHLDRIYTKLGYGGNCSYLQEIYPVRDKNYTGVMYLKELETKSLTEKENDIIYETLGEYSTRPQNQYLEIFAEAFTKFICDSLKGIEIVKNPIDNLRNSSLEFKKILKKICNMDI